MPRNITSFGAGPKYAPCSVPGSMVADGDEWPVATTTPGFSVGAASCELARRGVTKSTHAAVIGGRRLKVNPTEECSTSLGLALDYRQHAAIWLCADWTAALI